MRKWLWILNLIVYFIALALWIILSEHWMLALSVTGIALVLTLILLATQKESLPLSKKKALLLSSIGVKGLFLGIVLILINAIFYYLNWSWDLHPAKLHTLSSKTQAVLAQVSEPTQMIFFSRKSEWPEYRKLLELYINQNDKLSLQMKDLDIDLVLAQDLGVQENATLVIKQGERAVQSVIQSELSITNALLKMIRRKTPSILFLKGQGEFSLQGQDPLGLDILYKHLEKQGLKVLEGGFEQITPEVLALVIWGASQEFTPGEIEKIRDFLKAGRGLMVGISPSFSSHRAQDLNQYLEKDWGVKVNPDLVIDQLSSLQGVQAIMPVVNQFEPNHFISSYLSDRMIFPFSSSLDFIPQKGVNQTALLWTHPFPGSWGETNLEQLKEGGAKYEEGDFKGPRVLAVALEKNSSRAFVSGSARIVSNSSRALGINFQFFNRALDWILKEEPLSQLERPKLQGDQIFLNQYHLKIIVYGLLILFPILLFLFAAYLYWKRKQL